jgi:hypothetical protein
MNDATKEETTAESPEPGPSGDSAALHDALQAAAWPDNLPFNPYGLPLR